jgi:hypothetical protein
MRGMNQARFDIDPLPKKTRREVFLEEMDKVVPWAELVALIQPHARGAHQALGGRPPFPVQTMLRVHCLQLWWNLSDLAMEEELHDRPLYRGFAGLSGAARLPDASGTGNRHAGASGYRHQIDLSLASPSASTGPLASKKYLYWRRGEQTLPRQTQA